MTRVRATVRNGRLVLDEPTQLPEGAVLDLVLDDEGDDLDDAERATRDEALARAWEQASNGQGRNPQEVIERLRDRK